MQDLILVAGHAVPVDLNRLDSDEGWYLKHFQAGEGRFYVEHVEAGVRLAAANPASLLLFSGGQTDQAAGPRSEAQGYWLIAEHRGWFGAPSVRERATTEEFSLDSFENVLCGICRFHEFTGAYPRSITAVGWAFKGPRFDLHRAALRWPAARWRYVGPNDPPDLARAEHFEAIRRSGYLSDPYGAGPEPASKRSARNPFRRQHGYAASCPDLAGLLAWQGPDAFPGFLPWDNAASAG
jgi:hypothetical protein